MKGEDIGIGVTDRVSQRDQQQPDINHSIIYYSFGKYGWKNDMQGSGGVTDTTLLWCPNPPLSPHPQPIFLLCNLVWNRAAVKAETQTIVYIESICGWDAGDGAGKQEKQHCYLHTPRFWSTDCWRQIRTNKWDCGVHGEQFHPEPACSVVRPLLCHVR